MAIEIFRPLTIWGRNQSQDFSKQVNGPANYSIVPTSLANDVKRILDPHGPFWNQILFAVCIISTLLDPLFFYITVVNDKTKCVGFDEKLAISAAVFRTVIDFYHIIYSTFKPSIVLFIYGRNTPHRIGRTNARNYFSRSSFFKELLSCFPIPQETMADS